MKKALSILMLISLMFLTCMVDLDARGGRGGGGRGGRGGGGRSRSSVNRGPSMSRSAPRSRPTHRTAPRSRPTHRAAPRRPAAQPRPRPEQRMARPRPERPRTPPARTGAPSQREMQRFLDGKPRTRDIAPDAFERARERVPAGAVARPRGERFDQMKSRNPERFDRRKERADNIRDNFRENRDDYSGWFDRDYWDSYGNPDYYFDYREDWWKWATWGVASSWIPWAWGTPIYYDYGYGGNVYEEDGTIYVDDQVAGTTEEYAEQAEEIASNVVDVDGENVDWLPLGVFALTSDEKDIGTTDMYMQLAVSQEGIIAGQFMNTTSGAVKAVEGMVDEDSQRAAWAVVGTTIPVMETGIYNLTQDEAPALVHFADGQTQKWLLVRLEK